MDIEISTEGGEKYKTLKCEVSKTLETNYKNICQHNNIIIVTMEYEGEQNKVFAECANCGSELYITTITQETRKAK